MIVKKEWDLRIKSEDTGKTTAWSWKWKAVPSAHT